MAAPVILPAQVKSPVALVTVQPIAPEPPPSRMSPVDVPPIAIVPVVPASRVKPVAAAWTAIAVLETLRLLTAVAVRVPPDTLPPLKVPPLSVPPEIVAVLIAPDVVIVPMLTKLPLLSMRSVLLVWMVPATALILPVVAAIPPVTCRARPPAVGAWPIPSLVLVVSATSKLDVPVLFWIWKAVVESALSWKVVLGDVILKALALSILPSL